MPYAIKSPNLLAELNQLPIWKVAKLPNFTLRMYLYELKGFEDSLNEQLQWIWDWRRHLERESDRRQTAAEEIERRRQRDIFQAKRLEERNARLEEQYNRDTYAE